MNNKCADVLNLILYFNQKSGTFLYTNTIIIIIIIIIIITITIIIIIVIVITINKSSNLKKVRW